MATTWASGHGIRFAGAHRAAAMVTSEATVVVQGQEALRPRAARAAAGQPAAGCSAAPVDELGPVAKVDRGDTERAQRRKHVELGLFGQKSDLEDEALLNQEREGVQGAGQGTSGGCIEGAGDP